MSVATVAPAQELPSAKVSAAAELTGTVREQGTRDPLPGIKVTLRKSLDDPSPLVTETDDEGRFRFAELTPGPAWLELRAARIRTTKGQETLPAGRRSRWW